MRAPQPLPARTDRLARLSEREHDVLVVGGGITGAGLALDLALRGIEVALVERGDWAEATSGASSRLIHGGLRYLEQLDFALVRDSCLERGLLLHTAAGLVWPERFVFPLHRGGRVGRAKLAAGLALYTAVSLPRALGLPHMLGRQALRRAVPGLRAEGLLGGGSYLDGATDDARLTLAVIATALEAGASCVSRVEATALADGDGGVEAELLDVLSGERLTVRARAAVLAGGPFTDRLRARAGLGGRWVQPTRGSHVLVPRERLPTDGAVIFESPVDGRVMFLIPWPRYTVIGTTDVDADAAQDVHATAPEVRYLLDSANGLVPSAGLGPDDVVSTWAGLRPLLAASEENPSARSREERVEREGDVWSVAGGKLTGFRSMAEKLGAQIARELGRGDAHAHSPTRRHRLRGADELPVPRPGWSSLGAGGRPVVVEPRAIAWRRRYASLVGAVGRTCDEVEDGRRALDVETSLGEVDWAVRNEDALRAEDVLFRRTDLGLERPAKVRPAAAVVLERMARLLGWSAERRQDEERRVERTIAAAEAWRAEWSAGGSGAAGGEPAGSERMPG